MKTETRDRIMEALLTTTSMTKAAEAAGVSRRTVKRYLADADFSEEYEDRRKTLVKEAAAALQHSLSAAVDTLYEIVSTGSASERLSASRMILEYGLRYTELHDLAARLVAVEEVLKDR